jgi:hypothetical protein
MESGGLRVAVLRYAKGPFVADTVEKLETQRKLNFSQISFLSKE